MLTADRYVRTGTAVPVIYPGTLRSLQQALREAQRASCLITGEHVLKAVYGSTRVILRVFEAGECTWTMTTE